MFLWQLVNTLCDEYDHSACGELKQNMEARLAAKTAVLSHLAMVCRTNNIRVIEHIVRKNALDRDEAFKRRIMEEIDKNIENYLEWKLEIDDYH